MKRNLKTAIVTALVMCLVLGNVPFRAILVCVHGGGGHGEEKVHLHYGQLPGQPCHESPEGLTLSSGGEGRRHFSLDREILNKPQSSVNHALRLSPLTQHLVSGLVEKGSACIGRERPFDEPSFIFLDTAFTPTTVLII